MQDFFKALEKNSFGKECVVPFTKDNDIRRLDPKEFLWGGGIRTLSPPRITTAWLIAEDPLMILAGESYRSTEVRDKTFELQKEALANLRGNRKLTKGKMSDALSSLKPNVDQTKVLAGVLLALKKFQTVCYDIVSKKVWTMPEDLRVWSTNSKTLWVDARCDTMLEFDKEPNLGTWLAAREVEGWEIQWPVAEGSFDEIKEKMIGHQGPRCEPGTKLKKEDWARTLGKIQAIENLIPVFQAEAL